MGLSPHVRLTLRMSEAVPVPMRCVGCVGLGSYCMGCVVLDVLYWMC